MRAREPLLLTNSVESVGKTMGGDKQAWVRDTTNKCLCKAVFAACLRVCQLALLVAALSSRERQLDSTPARTRGEALQATVVKETSWRTALGGPCFWTYKLQDCEFCFVVLQLAYPFMFRLLTWINKQSEDTSLGLIGHDLYTVTFYTLQTRLKNHIDCNSPTIFYASLLNSFPW